MKHLRLLCIVVFLMGSRVEAMSNTPSCNELLSSSSSDIDSIIHDLAKLRFDLDQRLARGESDGVTRELQSQYSKKEAEILAATQLDRDALVARVQSEIEFIQAQAEIEESHQAEVKDVERQAVSVLETRVTQIGQLQIARKDHAITVLQDGRVLVAGGKSGPSIVKSIEVIDPQTGKSEPLGELKEGRQGHDLALLADGRILVLGGYGAFTLKPIEVIDPKTGKSEVVGELKVARKDHALSVFSDGRIMVTGGASNGVTLSSVEMIDPNTFESKIVGELKEPRQGHTQSVLPDGKILLVGGKALEGNGFREHCLDSIEVFDPSTGESKIIGNLIEARAYHTQALLSDGRVLVVGGDSQRQGALSSIEVIDPKTGESKTLGRLKEARWGHTESLLSDDRVLIVGGYNEDRLESIELIDPDTGTSRVVKYLKEARSEHAQAVLPDGQVIVVGGHKKKTLSSIELIRVERK